MPRSRSVSLEGRLEGCLYRASPRPRGRRPRGLIWTALGGCRRAERRRCREWRRGVQKPLAGCQGKTVPGAVLLAVERSAPGGPPRPWAAGYPGSGRAALDPGKRGRRGHWKLRRRAAAVLCLVAECSAALSVLENCSRKVLGGSSGESKNCPGKMIGEPNTY
jgi:hypothetical protein